MLSADATNTNLIVFGLTQQGLEPTIYPTQGEFKDMKERLFDWTFSIDRISYLCRLLSVSSD